MQPNTQDMESILVNAGWKKRYENSIAVWVHPNENGRLYLYQAYKRQLAVGHSPMAAGYADSGKWITQRREMVEENKPREQQTYPWWRYVLSFGVLALVLGWIFIPSFYAYTMAVLMLVFMVPMIIKALSPDIEDFEDLSDD